MTDTSTATERPQPIHLRSHHGDQTLTFTPRGDRLSVLLSPDNPLTYGYDDAGLVLDAEQVARLRYWFATGRAVPRGEEVPDFAAQVRAETLREVVDFLRNGNADWSPWVMAGNDNFADAVSHHLTAPPAPTEAAS